MRRRRPLDGARADAGGGGEERSEGGVKACLATVDLVSIGVGSCCGTGMYLTAGLLAIDTAGAGGALALLIAGVGSIVTGLHYADLASVCPRSSGSVYMYSYVTLGELAAFLTGWTVLVEYVIGTAVNAVALSKTIQSLDQGQTLTLLNSAFQ